MLSTIPHAATFGPQINPRIINISCIRTEKEADLLVKLVSLVQSGDSDCTPEVSVTSKELLLVLKFNLKVWGFNYRQKYKISTQVCY